jgi:uncharacterized protein (TIGR00730 family)
VDDRRILQTQTADLEEELALIVDEFRRGFLAVAEIPKPAVTIFGSARVRPGHAAYERALEAGRRFAQAGWSVVTGGGPGVMEAANRGAREGGGCSVGFNIELPHEQASNAHLDVSLTFRHFYARKTMFVKAAEGFLVLPGGFGTADELFEALTLIQTRKVLQFPVVLVDRDFWGELLEWGTEELLDEGMISPEDLRLLHVTDDVEDAVATIVDCYRRNCAEIPAA